MNKKKFSRMSIAVISILLIAVATMAGALLYFTANQSHFVRIRGINLDVTPSNVVWTELVEGTADTQTKSINIANTKNTDLQITFSDDIATNYSSSGLSINYPSSFLLLAYTDQDVDISLVYDGSGELGDYSWTVTVEGTENDEFTTLATSDTYVDEADPDNINLGALTTMNLGVDASGNVSKLFIRFADGTDGVLGKAVTSATINLIYTTSAGTPTGRSASIYAINEGVAWSENSASPNVVTWNSQPTYSPTVISSTTIPASYGTVTFDVTTFVQSVASGEVVANGFVIMFDDESTVDALTTFGTRDDSSVPVMTVIFG